VTKLIAMASVKVWDSPSLRSASRSDSWTANWLKVRQSDICIS